MVGLVIGSGGGNYSFRNLNGNSIAQSVAGTPEITRQVEEHKARMDRIARDVGKTYDSRGKVESLPKGNLGSRINYRA